MDFRFPSLLLGVVLAAGVGCYTGSPVDVNRPPTVTTDGTEPHHDHDSVDDQTTGIPCSVSKVLITWCADCHGSHLHDGVDVRLLTYDDLTATHDHGETMTIAELALRRMRSTEKPMPPDERLGAADIAVFEMWIKAGLPRGSCGEEQSGRVDGGQDTTPEARNDSPER